MLLPPKWTVTTTLDPETHHQILPSENAKSQWNTQFSKRVFEEVCLGVGCNLIRWCVNRPKQK